MKVSKEQAASLQAYEHCDQHQPSDPRIEALVTELIGRVAGKWTMLSEMVPGISYKMLTQTLRSMEREGLVARTVHPVVPPKVEYKLTHLGLSLGAAFCGVWMWAEQHLDEVERARIVFDQRAAP
jgi:DNA-binding HxlR family transcriptional regulator